MENPKLFDVNAESQKPKKRITILADMHDLSSLPEKVGKMKEAEGDINVMIGDAFDSEIRSKIIDEFKRDRQAAIEGLSDVEKEKYNQLLERGDHPIAAYWMSRVSTHPELLQDIIVEVDNSYELFVEQFKQLSNSKWLQGNLERSYTENPMLGGTKIAKERPEGLDVVDSPKILNQDEENITILFPSIIANDQGKGIVTDFLKNTEDLIARNKGLKSVVIIAHENLFKGPNPQKFEKEMKSAGVEKYSIPFYMPNNYRKELLDFIFKVPESVEVKFVYGHLHDPKETTQKAMPFTDSNVDMGMEWGVNKKDDETGGRKTRKFDMYQLPFQSIHTIDILGGDVKINSVE